LSGTIESFDRIGLQHKHEFRAPADVIEVSGSRALLSPGRNSEGIVAPAHDQADAIRMHGRAQLSPARLQAGHARLINLLDQRDHWSLGPGPRRDRS
jgi:hypothetical protein